LLLTTIENVRVTGAPPLAGSNVRVTDTGTPRLRRRALASARRAEAVGVSRNLTAPGELAASLPAEKTISAGRHRPLSLMKPLRHLETLAANTPKRPLAKVARQRNVPEFVTDATNVIAPLAGSTDAAEVNPLVAARAVAPPGPAPYPERPGPAAAAGAGGGASSTVTVWVTLAVRPALSVTVNVTG
jgi:hypothetical protein